MKRSKMTKRALTLSIISIFVCILMLVGSTFAWFTDTVDAGKNKIQAGNLDVTLKHTKSDNTKELVTADTELFKIDIWEPGAMAYEKFEVSNEGNLALKYKLAMNIGAFNTVKETGKSLKDVLKVAVVEGDWTGTREDAKKLTFDKTLESFAQENILTQKNTSNSFTVFVYWLPSEEDNKYNLNGNYTSSDDSPLSIELGINLAATQHAFESDTFGSDYDDTTTYKEATNATEFTNLIKNAEKGEGVKLTSDIELTSTIPKSTSGSTVINLDGHTLSSTTTFTTNVNNNEELIIKNGNLSLQSSGASVATLGVQSGGSITLENVEYTVPAGAGIFPWGDAAKVKIINSTITTPNLAISTNANTVDNYNVQIDIINSTINSGTAVLVNIPCKLNIENSEINGSFHGVVVRGGTAIIKNTTITNTVSDEQASNLKDYFNTRNWASGNTLTLAALTIGNKHPTSYQYSSNVTLINTKIFSKSTTGGPGILPTVYMYGNATEDIGATLNYDELSVVGEVVRGGGYTTVNGN